MRTAHSKHNIKSRVGINHILIVILACLIGTQVFLSNRVATSGTQISQLEQRAVELEEQNRRLLAENVDYLSLHQLTQKAEELGFVEPGSVITLGSTDDTLALR